MKMLIDIQDDKVILTVPASDPQTVQRIINSVLEVPEWSPPEPEPQRVFRSEETKAKISAAMKVSWERRHKHRVKANRAKLSNRVRLYPAS